MLKAYAEFESGVRCFTCQKAPGANLQSAPGHSPGMNRNDHSRLQAREEAMRLIEADELRQYSQVLKSRSCSPADFELAELDTTDPKSDELLPLKGYVEIRRKSNDVVRAYATGDGTSWVAMFEKDFGTGRFD
jgi:hypothetical protein